MPFLIAIAVLIIAFVIYTKLVLTGPNLAQYDVPETPFYFDTGEVTSGQDKMIAFLKEYMTPKKGMSLKESTPYIREGYEHFGRTRTFISELRPGTAIANGIEVPGEWTLPKGYDATKRILFLHGGAFMVGSSISHRPMTDALAQRTGCAVFSPDYRMVPEHGRKDCNTDSKAAYDWILENGPDGPAELKALGVTGDSAGGGLTLMLLNYARDNGKRVADAAIAFAPTTDSTGTSPSMKNNMKSDVVLGQSLAPLIKLPKLVSVWVHRMMFKINPAGPEASPVFADLHDLPPTLIQVSNVEVLYDDARRYAEKAKRAGSPVTLQVWANMVHIFQHYDTLIPEAKPALDEAAKFFTAHGVAADKKIAAKNKPAKKTPGKNTMAKKAPSKRAVTKKAPVKKAAVKKSPVKKAATKKTPVKKVTAKKAPSKKTTPKQTPAKKSKS